MTRHHDHADGTHSDNDAFTVENLRYLPPTIDVVTAGKALGLGRTKSYELAKSGEFPCRVLALGRTYRVPTAELLRLLGVVADGPEPGDGSGNGGGGTNRDVRYPHGLRQPTQGGSGP